MPSDSTYNEYNKRYYETQKEKIKSYYAVKKQCPGCGKTITEGSKNKHLKSPKHIMAVIIKNEATCENSKYIINAYKSNNFNIDNTIADVLSHRRDPKIDYSEILPVGVIETRGRPKKQK